MSDIAKARLAHTVVLGGRDFVVKPAKLGRIKKLKSMVIDVIKQFDAVPDTREDAAQFVMDKLFEAPFEILSVFVKDVPQDIFETEEEDGVTIPEIIDAFQTCLTVNRFDDLNNFFSGKGGLMKVAMEAQRR